MSYPKDMSDPRWFDRELGKQKYIQVPSVITIIAFWPAMIVTGIAKIIQK